MRNKFVEKTMLLFLLALLNLIWIIYLKSINFYDCFDTVKSLGKLCFLSFRTTNVDLNMKIGINLLRWLALFFRDSHCIAAPIFLPVWIPVQVTLIAFVSFGHTIDCCYHSPVVIIIILRHNNWLLSLLQQNKSQTYFGFVIGIDVINENQVSTPSVVILTLYDSLIFDKIHECVLILHTYIKTPYTMPIEGDKVSRLEFLQISIETLWDFLNDGREWNFRIELSHSVKLEFETNWRTRWGCEA
jgi:hypothetical protein